MASATARRIQPTARRIEPIVTRGGAAAGGRVGRQTGGIVSPGYTLATVRVLGQRRAAMEGHVCNLTAQGMTIELDELLQAGTPVTVEFMVAGLGRLKNGHWPTLVATGEVARNENVDDFPAGPYLVVVRFVKISTISQAQISRFVCARGAGRA